MVESYCANRLQCKMIEKATVLKSDTAELWEATVLKSDSANW